MIQKLYKYLNPNIADLLIINDDHFGIKMSSLDQYNDPFERFLTIDFLKQESQMIAYYENIINMYKDSLVTCFSKRPDITPMWAHYADNMSGFVLEINESKLLEYFKFSQQKSNSLHDVEYMNEPNPQIAQYLRRAAITRKPRHLHWLTQALMSSMYFYKQSCWQYEEERRLVIPGDLPANQNGHHLLAIPFNCLDSIIIGKNAQANTKNTLLNLAQKYHINTYNMHIGKSYNRPFFVSTTQKTLIFNGKELEFTNGCQICYEAIQDTSTNICSWCKITTNDREIAHSMNSFNILASYGALDRTLAGYRAIDERYSKK